MKAWTVIVSAMLLLSGCDDPVSSDQEPSTVAGYLITAPMGGETFRIGDTVSVGIRTDAAYSSVLEISINNGTTWNPVDNSGERIELAKGDTTIGFVIPPTMNAWQGYDQIEVPSVSSQAKLRIYQYDANQPMYVMRSTFSIVAR